MKVYLLEKIHKVKKYENIKKYPFFGIHMTVLICFFVKQYLKWSIIGRALDYNSSGQLHD